jgi:hypothetical protein
MLVFNLSNIFQARGITNPAGFLRKMGSLTIVLFVLAPRKWLSLR